MALIACPECKAEVSDRAPSCPRCGYPLAGAAPAEMPAPIEADERRQAFEARIANHVARGFRVVSRTETTAQLVRPKVFSFFWATAWFLVCGIGVLVYLFWYAAKRDDVVYLSIDDLPGPPARTTREGGAAWTCARCGAAGSPYAFDCAHCGASRPRGSA